MAMLEITTVTITIIVTIARVPQIAVVATRTVAMDHIEEETVLTSGAKALTITIKGLRQQDEDFTRRPVDPRGMGMDHQIWMAWANCAITVIEFLEGFLKHRHRMRKRENRSIWLC